MSSESSLTLYRCGVCDSMFQSAPECYAHVITHEAKKVDENTTESGETSLTEANFEQTLSVAGAEDQIPDSAVLLDASSTLAGGQPMAPALEVLATASGECQKSIQGVGQTHQDDVPSVPVILPGEGGIQIHIQEHGDGGEDGSGIVPGASMAAEAQATVSYASLEQIRSQGDSIVIGSYPGVVCSTSEDRDIADILINIKQEKVDCDGQRKSSENIPEAGNEGQGEIVQPKKKKIKKIVSEHLKKNKIPVVRRRRKGEDYVSEDELENFYCCQYCGKRYAVLKSLRHHEKIHDTDKLLYCDVCQKGFVKPSELHSHSKTHMAIEEREKENNGKFKCKYCKKEYTIEKSLKHHEKVHEVGKRYMCDRCTKTFFKPSDLDRHQRVHKPLAKCYVCNKSFRNTAKLEHHVRAHPELMMSGHKNNIKLISLKACRYCDKKCSTFSQLCNHIRTHTKTKPFPCDICGKTFNRISNMNLHRKLHTGMKPFPCNVCGAAFADYANRNRHVKKYHQNDMEFGAEYMPRTSKVPVIENLPPAPKMKLKREDLVAEVMNAYRELDKAKEDVDVNVKLEGPNLYPGAQKNMNVVECRELTGIPQVVQNLISGQPTPDDTIDTTESGNPSTSGRGTEQVYVVFEDNPSICYVVEYEGDNPSLKLVQDGVKVSTDSTPSITNQDLTNMGILGPPAQDESGLNAMSQVEIEEVNEEDAEECLIFSHEGEEYDEDDDIVNMRRKPLINPDYVVLKCRQERKQSAMHKRFPCDTCGSRFAHRGSLKFHMRRHTREGVIYCSLCNAEFYRKSRLRVHMREHTGEKPYKCSVCERAFKVSYDLTIHMREHTGRDVVPCDHCDKVFYTRRAYNAHMRDQSTIKPYSCHLCGKLFKRGDQRRRHMLTHFEGVELPFKCHMCERSFGDSSNRKRHIIKVHGVAAMDSMPKKRVSLANHVNIDNSPS